MTFFLKVEFNEIFQKQKLLLPKLFVETKPKLKNPKWRLDGRRKKLRNNHTKSASMCSSGLKGLSLIGRGIGRAIN